MKVFTKTNFDANSVPRHCIRIIQQHARMSDQQRDIATFNYASMSTADGSTLYIRFLSYQ